MRIKTFASKNQQEPSGSKDTPLEINDDPDIQIIREESDKEKLPLNEISSAEDVSEDEEQNRDAISVSEDSDAGLDAGQTDMDDKKKMGMNTTYDGFQIYGRILCLVVKRKDNTRGKHQGAGGQAMMEGWIASTQDGVAAE